MFMPQRHGWLGVDFGAGAVKIAQLERRGGVARLVRAAVLRRDIAWDAELGPESPALSSSTELRTALALANGPIGRESAAVLSMRLYDLRSMHAVGVGADAATSVADELTSIYGGGEAKLIHDFWSTHTEHMRPNSENTNVLTVSKEWANQVCDDLESAKMFGEALDGPPLAHARAIELNGGTFGKPMLVIDWGYNRTTVSVVRREQPLFVRCLRDSGFRNVVEHVEKSLGVTSSEAQKVLVDFGLPEAPDGGGQDLQRAIGDIIAEPLRAITDELHRTLTFLQTNRRGQEPEEAILFGGGATMRNADRFIERAIAIRTQNYSLNGETHFQNESGSFPIALLGASIGLSTLAWGGQP